MNTWAVALLPLVGVVLGAGLQFLLSRAATREQRAATLRSKAYADYLRAEAASGHLRSDEDLRDAHRDAADAKARIAIYGTTDVVRALPRFEEVGAMLSDATGALLEIDRHADMLEKFDVEGIPGVRRARSTARLGPVGPGVARSAAAPAAAVFPEGISFDGKRFVRTGVSTPAFKYFNLG